MATSPFDWRSNKAPTVFASDVRFLPLKSGKDRRETASDTVARETAKRGRNPGTLSPLTPSLTRRKAKRAP